MMNHDDIGVPDDDLAFARGCINTMLLGAVIWLGIIVALIAIF